MSYFELGKEALRQLRDEQLEELVFRLAEAEVAANGGPVSAVTGSGASNAPDGGVDVRVDVSAEVFSSGFLPRSNTIIQVKKHKMPAREITKEMRPGGQLRHVIAEQAKNAGAYILVSLEDDCSDSMLRDRRQAMKKALAGHPNHHAIHLDFYDRSKLHQWLRQHSSVTLWLRNAIGQPLSGWQPYGRWSHPPAGDDDTLILAYGVSVTVPESRGEKLTLETAIPAVRKLIRETTKAVRVLGLSGVGKTRFVQALFEDVIGDTDPLDRTQAIYGDTGADLQPSARAMVETLINEQRSAILVLDNCSTSLHGELAKLVAASPCRTLKLITVEYDIREDKPQTTYVVHMTADGTGTAELLLRRRYPGIGSANAHRVAAFADGNARIALAVAERVEKDESCASLSDDNLFNRLFQQRNQPDDKLRRHAEALALVYSYAVEEENGIDELAVLGQLVGATRSELFRATATLLERGIAQQRGKWRAVLPQAIANRLAASALLAIAQKDLMKTFFCHPSHRRLCRSFAHRIGMLHDHDVAQAIAKYFLQECQRSVSITRLDDDDARILEYLAPVVPEEMLTWIEIEINAPGFKGLNYQSYHQQTVTMIPNQLTWLAYEKLMFNRCINLLVRIADFENNSNNSRYIHNRIVSFFRPCFSGTHATLAQCKAVVREMLWDNNPNHLHLGLEMLDTALSQSTDYYRQNMYQFGARPRDYGFSPNDQELAEWYQQFIQIAVEAGCDEDSNLSSGARQVLARNLYALWEENSVEDQLIAAVKKLNKYQYWTESYKEVLEVIYLRYYNEKEAKPIPAKLNDLKNLLEPKNLMTRILFFVFENCFFDYIFAIDSYCCNRINSKKSATIRPIFIIEKLGEEFAQKNMKIDILGNKPFTTTGPEPFKFGGGLAMGSRDLEKTWQGLVDGFTRCANSCPWILADQGSWPVLSGFLHKVQQLDQTLLQQFLDQAANDEKLQMMIVNLHPISSFDHLALERCLRALDCPGVRSQMYGQLLYCKKYPDLPADRIIMLAEKLLKNNDGAMTLVYALGRKLEGNNDGDPLAMELSRIALLAAAQVIKNFHNRKDKNDFEYKILHALKICLSFCGNDDEKDQWLDAIFTMIDQSDKYFFQYTHTMKEVILITVSTLLEGFLDRTFGTDNAVRDHRLSFLLYKESDVGFSFADAGADRLIQWCQNHNEPAVWNTIGGCLTPENRPSQYQQTKELTQQDLTELRCRFLEACPDPQAVMEAYADTVVPNFWSGSRAKAIRKRLDTRFHPLVHHPNQTIADYAQSIIDRFQKKIEDERKLDQQRDQVREQRFEP